METKCGICEEKLPAVSWSVDCEDPLCHNCNEMYKTMKISRLRVLPKSQTTPHTEEKVKLYKNQSYTNQPYCKTCSKLICRYCTLKDHPRGHRDHDFDFVNEVVDEEREKMKQVTAPLKLSERWVNVVRNKLTSS